jgi:sirohydrochlorin cobaltochelatase
MLVVVGRGTSVATANAEAAKIARIVAENLGFGWCETVYSGVTFPSVGRGLEMAAKLGFKKIVVAPYFLFSGRLIGRINAYAKKVAQANPEIEFRVTDYLRDQSHVINTFVARIEELAIDHHGGEDLMQDFQARLAAGEVTVHHHHAEYQPEGHSLGHTHAHSHNHDHDHHHEPYRHIAHPHGPRTMIDENVCCCFMSQFPREVVEQERAMREQAVTTETSTETPQCQQD